MLNPYRDDIILDQNRKERKDYSNHRLTQKNLKASLLERFGEAPH
jgi:hypothetical protein